MHETKDPVCGMTVTKGTAAGESVYHNTTYYFCSTGCKEQFDEEPAEFASKAAVDVSDEGEPDLERHEPPHTKLGGIVAPKFGSAGSGGAEYERLPEQHDH